MKYSGWGRYPAQQGELVEPADTTQLQQLLRQPKNKGPGWIPRGAGRSYGDSALADRMLGSRYLDNFRSFDQDNGLLACAAGTLLSGILDLVVPAGWFLPVLPGTSYVSVGGAIASDIHGKNHHRDGCFSRFVRSLTLMLASGEIKNIGPADNPELFRATCGGMGLTGMILEATLQLVPLQSARIRQQTLASGDLTQVMELFEAHHDSHYSVAWLDCMARGNQLGRSILFLGEHEADDHRHNGKTKKSMSISVPFNTPGFLLNRYTMGSFNHLVYHWQKRRAKEQQVHYDRYFFPLDRILHWNRLYGRNGFLQYQFVLPLESAGPGLRTVLEKISAAGKGSFLCVLKKMGSHNGNLLSFPVEGYTLALDFKYESGLFQLLDILDEIVLAHGGRLYLAKDARMSEHVFKASYPGWTQFVQIKHAVDPDGVFASTQSQRLGI
ncbi:MAG: FAD-binding oxidoreductase [Pseudohongiellaceae bacterium]